MLRVLFLHAELGRGGEERVVQAVHDGLCRDRFDPAVCALYRPGPVGEEMRAAGAAVYEGFCHHRFSVRSYFRLRDLVRELGTDLLHTTDNPLPLFWAGMLRRRGHVARLIAAYHSTGRSAKLRRRAIAKRVALPAVDRFVALSDGHRDFIAELEGLDPGRFTVIPNGVDTAKFAPSADRTADRRESGLPDGPLVGIVAGLRKEKNHEMFVDMAALLRADFSGARFVAVGGGDRRAQLERYAEERGVGEVVRFFGPRDDVPRVVRSLDVLTLTSHPVVETFPLVLLEGMASGVPVCTTDVGSVREMLEHGVHGFISPAGDAAAMAENVGALLRDPPLRARMGGRGRDRVLSEFTVEAMVRRYERLFEEVCAK